ncbi:MAG: class I SAM-dependent methyltransferase [Nitrospirae bacterium]|nr:MAG: class I SAM-dependent methyltransferase [Nitrospirota bacterium]
MTFDHVHPDHHGPNTVHMTRLHVAKLILDAGHRLVLDVPCGTGALTQLLLAGGREVVSADLCPEGFVVPGRSAVRVNLNTVLPFESETFDAVACVEGIEHIENPHLLAREANRILHKGGMLYVTTPNVLSIRSRLSYLLRGYPDQFHYMVEIDPATGAEQPIAHINPIGFLELRYVLSRWGFRVDLVQANRQLKKGSWLYQAIRWLLQTKGKRSAATHPSVASVRHALLSDAVLFGEGLIIGATKVVAVSQESGK